MRSMLLSLIAGLALAILSGTSWADPPDYWHDYWHGRYRMSNYPPSTMSYLQTPGGRFSNAYSIGRPFQGTMPYNNYQSFVWNGSHTPFFYWNPSQGYGYGTGWTNGTNFPNPYQFAPR